MPHPSSYSLIRKANRHATATDRWAALKNNAQERISFTPPAQEKQASRPASDPYPAPQAPQPYAQQPQPARAQPPHAQSAHARQPQQPYAQQPQPPYVPQPPFPPPQPRHSHLDEISTRHKQAVRNAMAPQAWQLHKAQERPAPAQPPVAAQEPAPAAQAPNSDT